MKNLIISILITIICPHAFSQLIIKFPQYGETNAYHKIPFRIEVNMYETRISFHNTDSPGKSIIITDTTYIQANNSVEKLYIKSSKGIKINEAMIYPPFGELQFELIFPVIDVKKVDKIRYVEPFGQRYWYINDIQIRK